MSAVSYYYLASPCSVELIASTPEQELLQVAIAINKGRSAEQVVDILFDTLDSMVPYDRIGLAILKPPDILHLQHVRSRSRITWGIGAEAPITGTSLEPIVRESKIRIINDLAAYAREHPRSETAPLLLSEGIRSSLTLPIMSESGPLGVLFFSSTWTHAYGPHHVEFLKTLAAGIGTALERAKLIEDLQQANTELKSLDRLKTNFLSNLSHELRTPLSQVAGYADLLEEVAGEWPADHRGYLHQVLDGAQRLQRLLDDLFSFTALESEMFQLDWVEVDLGALIRELAAECGNEFSQTGLALKLDVPEEPLRVDGDPPKLARVVRSLLDNARKFTPAPGEVMITAGQDAQGIFMRVRDTGIGISPEHQARVFDKFFQVEGGPARAHGGTGLGLALAKAIIEAHRGTIHLHSEPQQGSTFEIRLPRPRGG